MANTLTLRKFNMSEITRDSVVLVIGRRRSGKCLAKDQKVVMYDGSLRKVQYVGCGDILMGDDSKPRVVVDTCHGVDVMYKIRNKFGETYIVNSEHILTLMTLDGVIFDIPVKEFITYPRAKRNMYFELRSGCECRLNSIMTLEYRTMTMSNIISNSVMIQPNVYCVPVEYQFYSVKYIANSLGMACYKDIAGNVCVHTCPLSNISVQNIGNGEYYGFELDANHRFLTEHFIVTHNSWLVRDIFYHNSEIPSGIVFSGTEEASPFFGTFIPDIFIHSSFKPELIQTMLEKQKHNIKEKRGMYESIGDYKHDGKTRGNNVFIVLDDMIHDAKEWNKNQRIQEIFFNGRHYNIFFILTAQYINSIPPNLRTNVDYVFLFNEPSVGSRRKSYENFGGMLPTFNAFCEAMDAATTGHNCLVLKTSGQIRDINDQVFFYCAEDRPKFKVCHPKVWNFHSRRYNKEYDTIPNTNNTTGSGSIDLKDKKLRIIVSKDGDIIGHKLG